jgi:hypothetical protein
MVLGDLAKEFAKQAITPAKDLLLDSLRPTDAAKAAESTAAPKTAPAATGEPSGATMVGQVQAMQRALKDDEELVVLCQAAGDILRVFEIFVPTWSVAVLSGIDGSHNTTRVVSPFDSLQLVCKVMKVSPPAKPAAVRVVAPRPRPDAAPTQPQP